MSAVAQLDDRRAVRALQRGVIDRLRADLAPKPVKKRKPKRLPRAHKAIAWGKPDRRTAEGVFASMERMSVGLPPTYRHRYGFRDVAVVACGAIILAVVFAAGIASTHGRGSHERTDVQDFNVQ